MSPPDSTKRHQLTSDERDRGREAAQEARRANSAELREAAKASAIARLAEMSDAAVTRLNRILENEDDQTAYRAAKDVLDRIVGREVRHEHDHSGSVEVAVREAREQLATRLAGISKRRGTT